MTLRRKILLLATIPLVLSVAIITLLVNRQAGQLAAVETSVFEETMLAGKKAELLNYVSLAQTSIDHLTSLPRTASAEDIIEAQTRS